MSKNTLHPSMKDVAKMVLDRYANSEMGIRSEAGREMIADELGDEMTHYVRNLWKEDFGEGYVPKNSGKNHPNIP